MIKIVIARDLKGFIRRMSINGHSGYAQEGHDIICSAVSVTAYTAAGALGELAGLDGCCEENSGHMVISLPAEMTARQKETAGIILETTAVGFKQIELSYGKYVVVIEEEV